MKLHLTLTFLVLLAALPSTWAQTARTGSVSGRIFNPVTEEYVRNAQVRVVQTGEEAISESGGFYTITGLPAGEVTLELRYIGYPVITTKATITSGATTTVNFDLLTPPPSGATQEEIVQLEAFTVSADRAGQAKLLMEQRASMNITQQVASDLFGEDTEGNLGEFMRNLPGVQLNTDEGEVSNVRIGGFGAEYTAVTVDGVSLATASATEGNSRAANFRAISLNSIDGLEISRTVSADMDANAPAGTINLRSKRAFDRKGQRIVAQANLAMSSAATTFDTERGPHDDKEIFKILPGGSLTYSNAFSRRFGILFDVSESNIYSEENRSYVTYNRSPTATDSRPEVPTSHEFRTTSRRNRRFASTMTLDWRATNQLTLSLTGMFNYSRLHALQRTARFSHGTRGLVQGDDPTHSIYTIHGASAILEPWAVSRLGQNITWVPKFEYKVGSFRLEGLFSSSEAKAWYDPLEREGALRGIVTPTASSVNYNITRGQGLTDSDYKVTQTSGPDIADGSSYTFPRVYLKDGRKNDTKKTIAKLDATFATRFFIPIKWKAGYKMENLKWKYQNDSSAYLARYIGTLTMNDFASGYPWDTNIDGLRISSISGGGIFMPNLYALGRRYKDHPEEFESDVTANNYYTAYVENDRNFEEDVNAGYIMGTGKYGRLTFQAGVRREDTHTKVMDVNAYTAEETEAQGFAVGTDGVATSIEGVQYQFLSRPRVSRERKYHNYFPSASIKYQVTSNFDIVMAAYKSIRRPGYRDATGFMRVAEETAIVYIPNRNLKTEKGESVAVRLSYYFKQVGQLSASFYQTELTNMINTNELTAEEFGWDPSHPDYNPRYETYIFSTNTNSGAPVRVRSMELSYSQNLGFLGRAFRRCRVHLNYTRAYAEEIKTMLAPHQVSAGFNYVYKGFRFWSNANWTDDFPISTTGQSYRYHRTQVDAGTSWAFRSGYIIGLNARNLTSAPHIHMQKVPPSDAVMRDLLKNSITWTCYVKKAF